MRPDNKKPSVNGPSVAGFVLAALAAFYLVFVEQRFPRGVTGRDLALFLGAIGAGLSLLGLGLGRDLRGFPLVGVALGVIVVYVVLGVLR